MNKTRKILEGEERIGEPLEDYLRRRYTSEKKIISYIAGELEVSMVTVSTWMDFYGISRRNESESHLVSLRNSDGKTKKMLSLEEKLGEKLEDFLYRKHRLEGYDQRKIAKELGVSHGTIGNWMDYFRIDKKSGSEVQLPEGFAKPAEEELEELYRNMSSLEIADQLGVTDNTVRNWLKDYGIEIRNKSGVYDNKDYRKELVDKILQETGKTPQELATSDFKLIKKDDGSQITGMLYWYGRRNNCSMREARDILLEDLYGIQRADQDSLDDLIGDYLQDD